MEGLPRLDESVLKAMLSLSFTDTKTKLQPDAMHLASCLVAAFVREAAARAANVAHDLADDEVRPEHLERILPQLLLDFGP